MRASYGTTKYCMAFLRGVSCPDHSCMNLHEWGDESDCFTKEDLTTLYVVVLQSPMTPSDVRIYRKHTMKDTETRTRMTTVVSKGDEDGTSLPFGFPVWYSSLFQPVSPAQHRGPTKATAVFQLRPCIIIPIPRIHYPQPLDRQRGGRPQELGNNGQDLQQAHRMIPSLPLPPHEIANQRLQRRKHLP